MFVGTGSRETNGIKRQGAKGNMDLGLSVKDCGVISDRNGHSET